MKLRTSFFDKATFKKDITRYWPIWVLYTVLLLMLMLPTVADSFWGYPASRLNSSLEAWAIGNFLYAALVSQLLFGDLFNARMCYALHAMPATRTARFISHISAGMLFALVPDLICAVVMIPALESHLWFTSLIWLAVMMLEYLCFFGIGVLSAVCTGKRLAAVAVYTILNFFSLVIYYFAGTVIVPMMYGVVLYANPFLPFSPVATLSTANSYFRISWYILSENNRSYYFDGFGEDFVYLLIVAGIGVVLLAVSWLLYRRRKLESAGAFITSKWLSPVFLTLYTLCAGAFLPIFSSIFVTGSDDYAIPLIVGLIAGFFTGKMLLERTIRIFKKRTFIQFAVMVLAAGLVLWGVKADVFGIVSFVPEKEDIAKITQSYDNKTLTEEHQFIPVIALHQWAVDHPCDGKCGATHQSVSINYILRSGRTVKRTYRICLVKETNNLIADYKSAYTALNTSDPNFVPNPYSISSINCTIDSKEYKLYNSNYFEIFTKTHQLAIETNCDGSCGNKHFLFEITYTLPNRKSFSRTYQLCDTPQFIEFLAPLHYSDTDFVPKAENVRSVDCTLDHINYTVDTDEKKEIVVSAHKLALEHACSGNCGQDHLKLEISYWMKDWIWDNVSRTYQICDNEQGKEIIALITGNLSRTDS